MRKYTLLAALMLGILSLKAQDYKISFEGTGASTTVSKVVVENLTKNISITMNGDETLHLTGSVDISEFDSGSDNKMSIHPNPMNGFCDVEFETAEQSYASIGIYDMAGKKIYQAKEQLQKGHHILGLFGLGKGIYTLKITSEKYSYTSKLISTNQSNGIAEIKYKSTTSPASKLNDINKDNKSLSSKKNKGEVQMDYSEGDVVLAKGTDGKNTTFIALTPKESLKVTFDFIACVDGDDNSYPIVKIGSQTWMAENMKTTKYENGTPIPLVTDSAEWVNLSTPGYCWYKNDYNKYGKEYGGLYNWYTVNSLDLCPLGWHVPTVAEWGTLYDTIGGLYENGKLLEPGETHWDNNNQYSTNATGFSAIASGFRGPLFQGLRLKFVCWSQESVDPGVAWWRQFSVSFCCNYDLQVDKLYGASVRCLKD